MDYNYNELFIKTDETRRISNKLLYDYISKYKLGDKEAKTIIINSNIPFVINGIIKKYKNIQYDKKELVAIGLIGLIKSVDGYDPTKNIAFQKYALTCVYNEIGMFLRSQKRNIKIDSIDRPLIIDERGNHVTYKDIIYDDNINIEDDYERKEEINDITNIIYSLPDREKKILCMNFGIGTDRRYTQEEIAQKLNITQSWVSKLMKEVLIKIRDNFNDIEKQENKNLSVNQKKLINS